MKKQILEKLVNYILDYMTNKENGLHKQFVKEGSHCIPNCEKILSKNGVCHWCQQDPIR